MTIITGIILGSAFSIAFGLAVVGLIFLILGDEYPRVLAESGSLLASLAIFTVLTALAGLSFYALVKKHRFRYAGQALLWSAVILTGVYYWP